MLVTTKEQYTMQMKDIKKGQGLAIHALVKGHVKGRALAISRATLNSILRNTQWTTAVTNVQNY